MCIRDSYIDAEKGVETVEDAINGAMDIIAENISDDADIRRRLRSLFTVAGVLSLIHICRRCWSYLHRVRRSG